MNNKLETRLQKIKKEKKTKLSNWNIKHNNNTWNQIEELIKKQTEIVKVKEIKLLKVKQIIVKEIKLVKVKQRGDKIFGKIPQEKLV